MNITRSEIIAAVAGLFAGVAAVTSTAAAVNAPITAGVAEFDLGKTTSSKIGTTHLPTFNKACSVSGLSLMV